MKIEYHNLYTHFILTTFKRMRLIPEKNRERIEKYITGIVNNNFSKLYAIYANPEHHKKESFEEEYQEFIKYYQKAIKK